MKKSPLCFAQILFRHIIFLAIALLYFHPQSILAASSESPAKTKKPFPNKNIINGACKLVANPDAYKDEMEKESKLMASYPVMNGIEDLTQVQGFVDANNDGKMERISILEGGTARERNFILIDSEGNKRIDITVEEKDYDPDGQASWRWMPSDLRWFGYKNYTFLLAGVSTKVPDALWYIDSNNHASKICEFNVKNKLKYAGQSSEALKKKVSWTSEFCRKIGEDKINDYLPEFKTEGELYLENETDGEGTYSIADIANAGKKKKLYRVMYSSGRGAGCGKRFYLIDGDQDYIKNNNPYAIGSGYDEKKVSIPKMSKNFYDAQQSDCREGMQPKLLRYGGYDLLEVDNPENSIRRRQIWLFQQDEAIPLCNFDYGREIGYKVTVK